MEELRVASAGEEKERSLLVSNRCGSDRYVSSWKTGGSGGGDRQWAGGEKRGTKTGRGKTENSVTWWKPQSLQPSTGELLRTVEVELINTGNIGNTVQMQLFSCNTIDLL